MKFISKVISLSFQLIRIAFQFKLNIKKNFDIELVDICNECDEQYDLSDPYQSGSKSHQCRECEVKSILCTLKQYTDCENRVRTFCEHNDCLYCYKRSFASHVRYRNLYGNNKSINFRKISIGSNKKYQFICECDHISSRTLNDVNNGRWCKYCANKDVCGNCKSCNEKSFSSCPKSIYLHKDNNVDPKYIFLGNKDNYKFNCDKCPHTFYSSPHRVVSGHWCKYCANQDLCEDDNCKICFNKSFASHPRAKGGVKRIRNLQDKFLKVITQTYIISIVINVRIHLAHY